jgi:hypothetical protein
MALIDLRCRTEALRDNLITQTPHWVWTGKYPNRGRQSGNRTPVCLLGARSQAMFHPLYPSHLVCNEG